MQVARGANRSAKNGHISILANPSLSRLRARLIGVECLHLVVKSQWRLQTARSKLDVESGIKFGSRTEAVVIAKYVPIATSKFHSADGCLKKRQKK